MRNELRGDQREKRRRRRRRRGKRRERRKVRGGCCTWDQPRSVFTRCGVLRGNMPVMSLAHLIHVVHNPPLDANTT
jgi:hypothetical protein